MAQESRLFDVPGPSIAPHASITAGPSISPSLSILPSPSILRTTRVSSDSKNLSAGMAATLSAELDGTISPELVADVVRAVLDESREAAGPQTTASAMAEARKRLRRFIRARLPR